MFMDPLQNWPRTRNIADLAAKGKVGLKDMQPGSEWKEGV